jgi:SSS family solute:Na+ symporter
LLLGYTIYSSGLVLPVICGFFVKRLRLHSSGAMAAIIAGGTAALFGKLMGYSHFGLVGMGLSGLLLFGFSWAAFFLERGHSRL